MADTIQTTSFLQYLLFLFTRNDTKREKKDLDRYDFIEFVDVNEEIKRANQKKTSQ